MLGHISGRKRVGVGVGVSVFEGGTRERVGKAASERGDSNRQGA